MKADIRDPSINVDDIMDVMNLLLSDLVKKGDSNHLKVTWSKYSWKKLQI